LELINKTRTLTTFPELGRKVPEFDDPDVRELIFRSYRIVYRVRKEKFAVEVSRFWHAARGTPVA
jgi:toxin ParE1/3/4